MRGLDDRGWTHMLLLCCHSCPRYKQPLNLLSPMFTVAPNIVKFHYLVSKAKIIQAASRPQELGDKFIPRMIT